MDEEEDPAWGEVDIATIKTTDKITNTFPNETGVISLSLNEESLAKKNNTH
jgi:hypothetical protein